MMTFTSQIKQEAVGADDGASFGADANVADKETADDREIAPEPMEFSAVKLLADRYPSFLAAANEARSKNESRFVLTVLVLITVMVLAAWAVWDPRYFHSDSDLVYNMGLYGGIMLLSTALYSLRKRVRFLKKLGEMSGWYYAHLAMGVFGPVLIIFHSSFTMKSLNSTVALVSMLCIIVSGIIGRYIYTRIGYHVHGRLLAIRHTEEGLAKSLQKYQGEAADAIQQSLSVFTMLVVNMPQSLFHLPGRFFSLRAKAAKCYVDGIRQVSVMLSQRAEEEDWDKLTYHAELAKEKRILREHVNALLKIGQLHFYERLLVGWRIFHIPLIFILFISGSVHVFAVHWY